MANWNVVQWQTVNDNFRTSCICAHLVCGHLDAGCEEWKPETTELQHPKRGRLDPRLLVHWERPKVLMGQCELEIKSSTFGDNRSVLGRDGEDTARVHWALNS